MDCFIGTWVAFFIETDGVLYIKTISDDDSNHMVKKFQLTYMPAFDGLRGVAVLNVLIFHSMTPWWVGGYIGVDIFFVLSGFLITAILISEYEIHSKISFWKFYLRRILRLFPAVFLLLLTYLLFFGYTDSQNLATHLDNVRLVLFYLVNVHRANGSYEPIFLGHTWSLSIEEQFYLLWPWVFFGLSVVMARKYIFFVLLAAALSVWGWRVFLYQHAIPIARLYNGFDTRADALLLGCTLAMLVSFPSIMQLRQQQRFTLQSGIIAGLCFVFLIYISRFALYDDPWMLQYGYFGVALSSTLILFHLYIAPKSPLASILRFRPLMWVGKISYGVYLWHYPIMWYMYDRLKYSWQLTLLAGGTLTLLCAALSYYMIERRFIGLRHKFSQSS